MYLALLDTLLIVVVAVLMGNMISTQLVLTRISVLEGLVDDDARQRPQSCRGDHIADIEAIQVDNIDPLLQHVSDLLRCPNRHSPSASDGREHFLYTYRMDQRYRLGRARLWPCLRMVRISVVVLWLSQCDSQSLLLQILIGYPDSMGNS